MNFPMDTTELLLYLTRFFIGSTLLLGSIWLLEKTQVIKNRDLAEVSWKSAVFASLLLLLPVSADWAPKITITKQTSDYIENITAVSTITPVSPVEPQHNQASNQTDNELSATNETAVNNTHKAASTSHWEIPSFIVIPGILAALAILALALTYGAAIRSLGKRQRVNPEHKAFLLLFDICDRADIKATPYLTWTNRVKSPLCLPSGEIVLPEWALGEIDEAQLRSLIAHEVAHFKHGDPIKLLILHVLTRLFFLQPLLFIAQKRLLALAEFAADEWAARHSENPKSVAEAIYSCAQQISDNKQPQWGLAMASNKSELRARIERLLDANKSQFQSTNHWVKGTVATTFLASVIGIPALAIDNSNDHVTEQTLSGDKILVVSGEGGKSTHIQVIDNDMSDPATSRYQHREGGRDFSVERKGAVQLSGDGIHIAALSEGGHFEITESGVTIDRAIKYQNNNGQMTTTFTRDDEVTSLNGEDKKWLKAMMLDFHRKTGATAAQRVEHLLNQGGFNAVFDELDKVKPHALRHYSKVMMKTGDMNTAHKHRLIKALARNKSDYEKRMAMADWLIGDQMDAAVKDDALALMRTIKSDYEMRMLLTSLLATRELSESDYQNFLSLSKTIRSNYEMRMLLTTALKTQANGSLGIEPYVQIAEDTIRSDYEMRAFITSMIELLKDHPEIAETSINAIKTIGSDYEFRLAAVTIAKVLPLEHQDWLLLINNLGHIDSDHELTEALLFVMAKMPQDQELVAALKNQASENISSGHSKQKLRAAFSDSQ